MDLHPDIGYAIWSDAHVLISGGNERTRTSVARMIHERSPRGRGSFAVVHADARLYDLMTALERLVAKPSGGTVFLQEAGALDSTIQDQLLRLIEAATRGPRSTKTRLMRIIAATGGNLLDLVRSNQFDADLFYRLNAVHVVLQTSGDRPRPSTSST